MGIYSKTARAIGETTLNKRQLDMAL